MADHRVKKRARIHRDEVKERHTSHWDMDLMPQAEFDRYMRCRTDWQIAIGRRARRTILGILAFGLFLCLLPTLVYWSRQLLSL